MARNLAKLVGLVVGAAMVMWLGYSINLVAFIREMLFSLLLLCIVDDVYQIVEGDREAND